MHDDRYLFTSARTGLRELVPSDADFIRALLNEPSFLRFIGDRQVRTTAEAEHFTETRYRQAYRDHGYGLWLVERRADHAVMGLCGFVRRDALPHADLGFAFLPAYEGQGYAFEATQASLAYGAATLGLTQVLAIVQPDNARSIRLLERLGFVADGSVTMPGDTQPVRLYRTG
ncbi:MAG: GNAT family N-acetyltransferase [Gemmatimonadaceae bacterium]|nr:GNAT family N-acetyltransferase [Gemmatimonadaceae bacterium]